MYSSPYHSPNRDRRNSPLRTTTTTPPRSSSVIAAFRELQDKARRLESERSTAIRTREEVRDLVAATQRARALWHQQAEIQATESLLHSKAESEKLRHDFEDLRIKTDSLEDMYRSLQRTLIAEKATHGNIDVEVSQLREHLRQLERREETLSRNSEFLNHKCDDLLEGATSSPIVHRQQSTEIRASLASLDGQIEKVREATLASKIKAEGLERYVELIVNINEDLITTITAKELTKEKILEFAKKYAPPHYSWPKCLHYDDIVELITDAAISAAKDGAVARAAAATLRAVRYSPLRGTSTSSGRRKRPSSAPTRRRRESNGIDSLMDAFRQATLYDDFNVKDPSATASRRRLTRSSLGTSGAQKTFSPASIADSLARAAAKAASTTVTTHAPSLRDIASYQMALENSVSPSGRASRRSRQCFNSPSSRGSPISNDFIPMSPYREHRDDSGIHVDSDGAFIPSGNTSQEFNEIANRNMVTRTGKYISSAMVSKVRSLHGDSFDC